MALNIRSGDILVVGSKEHSILWCGEVSYERGSTPSMKRMCRVAASTKRSPAVVNARRGAPSVQIASLKCTPLDPISSKSRNLVVREIPQAPTDLLETIVDGGDTFYLLVLERIRK